MSNLLSFICLDFKIIGRCSLIQGGMCQLHSYFKLIWPFRIIISR